MAKKTGQTPGRNSVSGRALLDFIERIERVREEKKALALDEAAIFAEVKAAGFEPKTVRDVLKRRAAKPEDVERAEANFDMYLHAIGMRYETPLFRSVGMMNVDLAARDEVIEAFKLLVPQVGEIIIKIGERPVRLWRDKDGVAHAEDYNEAPKPVSQPKKPSGIPPREPREIPDVDEEGARALGAAAFKDNQPIVSNPFNWDDPRRAAFDQGWREASGTDGFGPEED